MPVNVRCLLCSDRVLCNVKETNRLVEHIKTFHPEVNLKKSTKQEIIIREQSTDEETSCFEIAMNQDNNNKEIVKSSQTNSSRSPQESKSTNAVSKSSNQISDNVSEKFKDSNSNSPRKPFIQRVKEASLSGKTLKIQRNKHSPKAEQKRKISETQKPNLDEQNKSVSDNETPDPNISEPLELEQPEEIDNTDAKLFKPSEEIIESHPLEENRSEKKIDNINAKLLKPSEEIIESHPLEENRSKKKIDNINAKLLKPSEEIIESHPLEENRSEKTKLAQRDTKSERKIKTKRSSSTRKSKAPETNLTINNDVTNLNMRGRDTTETNGATASNKHINNIILKYPQQSEISIPVTTLYKMHKDTDWLQSSVTNTCDSVTSTMTARENLLINVSSTGYLGDRSECSEDTICNPPDQNGQKAPKTYKEVSRKCPCKEVVKIKLGEAKEPTVNMESGQTEIEKEIITPTNSVVRRVPTPIPRYWFELNKPATINENIKSDRDKKLVFSDSKSSRNKSVSTQSDETNSSHVLSLRTLTETEIMQILLTAENMKKQMRSSSLKNLRKQSPTNSPTKQLIIKPPKSPKKCNDQGDVKCTKSRSCKPHTFDYTNSSPLEINGNSENFETGTTKSKKTSSFSFAKKKNVESSAEVPLLLNKKKSDHKSNSNDQEQHTRKYKIKKPLSRKNKAKLYIATVETWHPGVGTIFCPKCTSNEKPLIKSHARKIARSGSGAACLLTCWPFCFLPYLFPAPAQQDLYCSKCHYFLGVYNQKTAVIQPNEETLKAYGNGTESSTSASTRPFDTATTETESFN